MARVEDVDLNLLVALDTLLAEESVTGAARRLGLSASAMSRTLARLRSATGDPLLAPAGRRLAPTPRALALREQVRTLVHDARAVFRPAADTLDPATLEATFTIRASQSFMESVCAPLVAAIRTAAPRVRLCFVPKPDKDLRPLRDGMADLEIGVVGERAPEVRVRRLFHDAFVGVARDGHPLLNAGPITVERFVGCDHVAALQRGGAPEPVDVSLDAEGLSRDVVVIVPGYPDAMRVVRMTNLVAVVPRSCLRDPMTDSPAAAGLVSFDLPVDVPAIIVSAMWHPRLDADPAQRWLRTAVVSLLQQQRLAERAERKHSFSLSRQKVPSGIPL